MKKLILSLALALGFCVFMQAQISVKSFELLETDLDANTYFPKKDLNGKTCAIIKIFTTQIGFSFEIGSLGIVATEQKPAEIWIYVPEGTMKLKIVHPQLGHISNSDSDDGYYWFPNGRVKSGCCYKLELITGTVHTVVEEAKIQAGWLLIDTEPAETELYITEDGSEKYYGNTPFQRKMPYGRYNFRLKRLKYHDEVGVAVVDKDRVVIPVIKMNPAFGSVNVTSEPSGANVYIDNDSTGFVTPCVVDELSSGSHSIKLQKKGYSPIVRLVKVDDGKETTLNVNMEARFAEITIKSNPQAIIKVNGVVSGKGNEKFSLQEGIYDIEASLQGHKTVTKQIEVVANQPQVVELKPIPIYGTLDILTKPRGASILINGESYGDTPLTIENMLIGEHDVVLTKAGYAMAIQHVTVTEGRNSDISLELKKGRPVSVNTNRSDDKIYIDGVLMGKVPCNVVLTYGNHEIKVEREGKWVTKNIVVKNGNEKMIIQLGFNEITPKWNSTVTEMQRMILERLLSNMVKVDGGVFKMGATEEQYYDAEKDESPVHQEILSDYYIGKYEVTQEEWQVVMGDNPSSFIGENLPVENVSWNDCLAFVEKLNILTGLNFSLPTEAQWEYAARGGKFSKGYKYSGNNEPNDIMWYKENSNHQTHKIGTKAPNELGLYDMSGNVWEWCSDQYNSYEETQKSQYGLYYVMRGGGWGNDTRYCRVSDRANSCPDSANDYSGIRLVLVTKE